MSMSIQRFPKLVIPVTGMCYTTMLTTSMAFSTANFAFNTISKQNQQQKEKSFMRSETYGEDPQSQGFKSDECNLIYSYRKNLNNHIKRKHSLRETPIPNNLNADY